MSLLLYTIVFIVTGGVHRSASIGAEGFARNYTECTGPAQQQLQVSPNQPKLKPQIKSLIRVFILTMDEMSSCNVKGAAQKDKPTKTYHPTLQFPSALQGILEFLC